MKGSRRHGAEENMQMIYVLLFTSAEGVYTRFVTVNTHWRDK
jgi:hypothetical protein